MGQDLYRQLAEQDIASLFHKAKSSGREQAMVLYNAVADRYRDDMPRQEKRLCALSLCRQGELSYAARTYSAAMNHYLAALRICEECGLDDVAASVYIGIGNLYSSQADYEMGVRFNKMALAHARKANDRTLQNKALNNLVGASCFAGRPDEGQAYYRQLAANVERTREYAYDLFMCKGLIASNSRRMAEAVGCYKQAIAYAQANRMGESYAEAANSCLAHLYSEAGHPDSALVFLKRNELLARGSRQPDLLAETLQQLAEVYAQAGDQGRAMACKAEYLNLADSLYNNEEFNAMKNAHFLYDANKNAKAINTLTAEKAVAGQKIRMQRLWLATLAAAFLVFGVLLVVVYRQKKQLRHAYNELFDRSRAYLDKEIGQPTSNNKTSQSFPTGGVEGASATSLLTPEQRAALVADIRKAMADTAEICRCDFSIDRLAELVGSNQRYVSEAINEEYGKNFRTLLNEYRIKEAMERLGDHDRYGNLTIKAIAEGVGYKSQANFITVFTKVTGMKPSVYRKTSRERK